MPDWSMIGFGRLFRPHAMRPTKRGVGWGVFWLLVVMISLWGIFGWYLDIEFRMIRSLHWDIWRQYFAANGWNPLGATPLGFAGMALLVGLVAAWLYDRHGNIARTIVAWFLMSALALVSVVTIFTNIAAGSASYAGNTTVVTPDFDSPPATLSRLFNETEQSQGEICGRVGDNADVKSCIIQSEFNLSWEARVASAQGAEIVLSRASEADNLSHVMPETVAYLKAPTAGKWSAIRDGRKAQPIVGVVEWDGVGRTELCSFEGDYELDMAFAGRFGHNLSNEIAKRYPNLLFDSADVWGYCKVSPGASVKEPVIVIPTSTRKGFEHVTTDRFGGLIVINGSSSGEPLMRLVTEIEPNEFPGPVYPPSLAAQQRQSFGYSAGIWNNWVRDFGYQTMGLGTQSANPSEYLLTSKTDRRQYWVTPLRSRTTDSEQVVAYSVTPADEATVGQLNAHRLYVLEGDDPRVVDMKRLHTRVTNAVNLKQAAFFTGEDDETRGKLTEFLPVSETTWQIYAERGGEVVYRVDVDIDSRIAPKVTKLTSEPVVDGEVLACDAPDQLTPEQIRKCIDQLVGELSERVDE